MVTAKLRGNGCVDNRYGSCERIAYAGSQHSLGGVLASRCIMGSGERVSADAHRLIPGHERLLRVLVRHLAHLGCGRVDGFKDGALRDTRPARVLNPSYAPLNDSPRVSGLSYSHCRY
jgi:hypothetical protein